MGCDTMHRFLSLSVLALYCCWSCVSADQYDDLLAWAKKNGAKTDHVKISTKADGQRGLFATKALSKGSLAVSVPPELAMCPQNFVKSALGEDMVSDEKLAESVTLQEGGLLAVLLLGEVSNAESFWAPYLATIPKDFGGAVATQMQPADFDMLEGTLVQNHTKDAVEAMHDLVKELQAFFTTHEALIRKHYPKIEITPERIQWAMSTVNSRGRIIHLMGPEAPPHGCLVPIVDMLNHRFNAKLADMDNNDQISQVLNRDVPEGDEIFTNYGPMTIELSFVHYGFSTVEMASNLGPSFRGLMERLLSDKEMMQHGPAHAENVAKQLLAKHCHGIEKASNAGVVG